MLIGRKEEIFRLKKAFCSEVSEFVAVYGRRRVGKTYLIRETFGKDFVFQYTGIYNIPNKQQLEEFHHNLLIYGKNTDLPIPKNWFEAFHMLESVIEASTAPKKVVFIDELPWMDSPNSRFLAALEHFWNGWASARKDILFVICGSATSWIVKKIFRNRGGLHNRVTCRMKIHQFTLSECEEYSRYRGLPVNRNMILEGYMVMGGIPYYWSYLDSSKSMAQNINDLFFKTDGALHDEFSYIYASIFNSPDKYLKIIESLASKKQGLTREEIIEASGLESNGQLTTMLENLTESGFIRKYCHANRKQKDAIYQLMDCFTFFYYRFLHNAVNADDSYWMKLMSSSIYDNWCGLAFERVCLLHTRQIKQALGIGGIMANVYSWHVKRNEFHGGVQIDMLIDRSDNVVNVCEMKYASNGYNMQLKDSNKLKNAISVLGRYLPEKKYIQPVLITSNGVVANQHSMEVNMQISADQLFLP